jgi:hypothetical protein
MLKQGEAVPRPYRFLVGATHWVALLPQVRMLKQGEAVPRPYNVSQPDVSPIRHHCVEALMRRI